MANRFPLIVNSGSSQIQELPNADNLDLTGCGILNSSATITLPTSTGTLATLAGTETFTNKTLTSPTLITPALGTPSSGTLTSCTGLPISTGVSGLGTGIAAFLATPSAANLISAVTEETGTGSLVFATSPTLITPALGTPSSGTLTSCTGLPIIAGTTGTLSVARGGTGVTSSTGSGDVVLATSPTLITPAIGTPSSGTLTNCTGLPIIAGTTGTLSVARGGTGVTSSTGSGAVVLGTAPSVSNIFLTGAREFVTISATAANSAVAFDYSTQSVLYYTSNATANWSINIRGNSGTTLNSIMTTGDAITVAFIVPQGGTAYYNTSVQVDGTTSGVTTTWSGGAPTKGNASGQDHYTYTVIKTGNATFTVFAGQTQFKA
jgi:hypothetical protein